MQILNVQFVILEDIHQNSVNKFIIYLIKRRLLNNIIFIKVKIELCFKGILEELDNYIMLKQIKKFYKKLLKW